MFKSLELFQSAQALARHAGNRQAVIARNIANADTPGYRARDIADFAEVWQQRPNGAMRATRTAHLFGELSGGASAARTEPQIVAGAERAPNGNSVSLEDEMVKAADTMRAHDMALSIYRSGLTLLRAALGRR